jgi:peroxiredoxin Q/BCP
MLNTGDQAPDFEATLDDGSTFRLSDYGGKQNVVLYFYPKAGTRGCTKQACTFRDNYEAVSAYNAMIVGVSVDSVADQAGFKAEHDLGFPLVADADKRVTKLYDAMGMFGIFRARATYVIDTAGVIRAAFRHDLAIDRHLDDVLAALKEIEGAAV